MSSSSASPIVVTGANGLVGAGVCALLSERGVAVSAVVRRAGATAQLPGVREVVGEFGDATFAAEVTAGAGAVISTAHPIAADRATQQAVAVEGTPTLARAAAQNGAARFIHVSTCAAYDRSPGVGDIDEDSALVGDDGGDYAVTKRDADRALARVDGITRVIVRPPVVFGPGPSSVWNRVRPAAMAEHAQARHAVAAQTLAWVHVDDLAALIADLATGAVAEADDATAGPLAHECTTVNACAGNGTQRDYFDAVTGALGVEPIWDDEPAWSARILSDRARGWGWAPQVDLERALAEVVAGIRA